jgi:hypothetical protein
MNRRLSYHEGKSIISGMEAFCYPIDRYVRHEKGIFQALLHLHCIGCLTRPAGSKENVKAAKPVKDGLIGETNN